MSSLCSSLGLNVRAQEFTPSPPPRMLSTPVGMTNNLPVPQRVSPFIPVNNTPMMSNVAPPPGMVQFFQTPTMRSIWNSKLYATAEYTPLEHRLSKEAFANYSRNVFAWETSKIGWSNQTNAFYRHENRNY